MLPGIPLRVVLTVSFILPQIRMGLLWNITSYQITQPDRLSFELEWLGCEIYVDSSSNSELEKDMLGEKNKLGFIQTTR